MKELDAIVVGAGPAGSSAAAILGAAGKQVALLDKGQFPREKTCGDGLTHKCLPHLETLGVLNTFMSQVDIEIFGYSLFFSNDIEITMRHQAESRQPFAYVMPRFKFDNILVENAKRHPSVQFKPQTRVLRLLTDGDRVIGVQATSSEREVQFTAPLVIDATGVNSPISTQVGNGNRDPNTCAIAVRGYFDNVEGLSDTIELYFNSTILPGYFWIFPTSPTTANIGCGTFQHIIQERGLDLRKVLKNFLDTHPVARKKVQRSHSDGRIVGGKIPLPMDLRSNVRNGLILVGDSAAFVDPLTAEGISFSMHSGLRAGEVASSALDQGDVSASALKTFDAWRAQEYTERFSKSVFFQEALPAGHLQRLIDQRLEESGALKNAADDRGYQYELAVKIKALLKAL